MARTEPLVLNPAAKWHRSTLAEWDALEERTQTVAKVVILAVVSMIAYHYSIVSLIKTIGLDTPLAYVGLVPFIAAGLAWVNRMPQVPEPAIYDRQLDYSIGLSLITAALLGQLVLPGRIGTMFWVNRLDLLFLPLFVTGSTILLFGVRVAWRQKVALAYLFLAWPWLYTNIFLGFLGGFTSLTLAGLDATLRIVDVARPVTGNPGVYAVFHHGREIPISVVSACSGIDGMVGFLLIGAALTAVVDGPVLRKALWLGTGLVLLWTTNLVRLLFIFWVGKVAGAHLALDEVHPIAGLAMFCAGVGLMTVLLRPFGLSRTKERAAVSAARNTFEESAAGGTPRVFAVTGILLVVAVVLSVSNAQLATFNPVAAATGEPKLGSFLADPASPPGWTPSFVTEYTLGQPLYGPDSRWFRYVYSPTSRTTTLRSTLPVTADVIDASNLSGFEEYGVTACYTFHGYTLEDVSSVNLGDGITGQALAYSGQRSHQNWSIVYWIWPVETGSGTRYERVILYLQNTTAGSVGLGATAPGEAELAQHLRGADPLQRLMLTNRAFLVDFARQIVSGQTRQKDTAVLISALQAPTQTGALWSSEHSDAGHANSPETHSAAPTASTGFWAMYRLQILSAAFWDGYRLHHVPVVAAGARS